MSVRDPFRLFAGLLTIVLAAGCSPGSSETTPAYSPPAQAVEMMLTSCTLALVTFSRMWGNVEGQVVSFFVMVVAAAEVVVGLAVVVAVFRTHRSASLDGANQLKN